MVAHTRPHCWKSRVGAHFNVLSLNYTERSFLKVLLKCIHISTAQTFRRGCLFMPWMLVKH